MGSALRKQAIARIVMGSLSFLESIDESLFIKLKGTLTVPPLKYLAANKNIKAVLNQFYPGLPSALDQEAQETNNLFVQEVFSSLVRVLYPR